MKCKFGMRRDFHGAYPYDIKKDVVVSVEFK
jgi:hypothetical protein